MALRDIFNGNLANLKISARVLGDTGDAQRVESIQQDDIAVALTASQARFTVSNTTILLSSKLPGNGEEYVYLEASVADFMWWDDGKDPATTPGHVLSAGYAMRISKSLFANFKMVRVSTDAIALLSAYKPV